MQINTDIKIKVRWENEMNNLTITPDTENKFVEVLTSLEMAKNILVDRFLNYAKENDMNHKTEELYNNLTIGELYGEETE